MPVENTGRSSLRSRRFRGPAWRGLVALVAVAVLAVGLVAAVSRSAPARADSSGGTSGAFVAATGRVYDTRVAGSSALPPGVWRTVPLLGQSGLPSTGVSAVVVTATAVVPSAIGSLNLYPGGPAPSGTLTTSLRWGSGNSQSNTAIVAPAADGTVQLRSNSTASTDLVLDLQGYFASSQGATPGGFVPVSNTRIVDTRSGVGAAQAKLATGGTLTVDATRTGQVPAGEASLVFVEVTVVDAPTSGRYVPYATGSTRPSVPSVNFGDGQNTTIGLTVPVNSAGQFSLYLVAGGPLDVVVDLQGYFTQASGGALFNPLAARVYDSRDHTQLAAGATRSIPIASLNGIPSVENGTAAVAAELHVVAPDGASISLRAWDSDYAEPSTTSVNSAESSLSLIAPGADNAIKVKNVSSSAIDLAVDVEGWFARSALLNKLPWAPMAAVQVPRPNSTEPGGLEYFYADGQGFLHAGYQPSVIDFDTVTWSVISGNQEIVGQPSVTVRSDKTLQATVLSTDTGVRMKVQTFDPSPAWATSFVNLGGTFTSSPTVGVRPDNSVVAFAVDAAGRLWARPQSGSAQYWQQLGSTAGFAGSPTIVTTATGLRLFVATTGGTVSTATYDNGVLSAWSDLGGVGVTDRPAAIMKPGFHTQVVVRQGDGSIVTKAQANDGSFPPVWTAVGSFTATGAPAVLLNTATGRVEVFARNTTDHYIYNSGETAAGSGAWRAWAVASLDKKDPSNPIPIASYTDPTITPYSGSGLGDAWLIPFREDPSGALRLVRVSSTGGPGGPQTSTESLPAPQ